PTLRGFSLRNGKFGGSPLCSAAMVEVILPVLDEAAALPWVLDRFPGGFHPLVVDNGSSDGSADIARRLGARVIGEPRRGFGAACWAGLAAARADVGASWTGNGSPGRGG